MKRDYIEAFKAGAKPHSITAYINSGQFEHDTEIFSTDIKTGFKLWDLISDGLCRGLYIITGASGLGKTTFAVQLADQLATQGNEVVFFSLEQSILEFAGMMIARRTALNESMAVGSSQIVRNKVPEKKLPIVAAARKQLIEETGDRLQVIEGDTGFNVTDIRAYMEDYYSIFGKAPVVFVDYLQILEAPPERRLQDKAKVDNVVHELRQIARDFQTPVFALASINRANYETEISFESIKESGNIEFTGDVVLGMQLQCVTDPEYKKAKDADKKSWIEKEMDKGCRKIEIKVLKNRFGRRFNLNFDYYPANCLILESANQKDRAFKKPDRSRVKL